MKSLTIRSYTSQDAAVIAEWFTDERSMHQWCADCFDTFPLPPEMLNRYYDSHTGEIYPFMALDGDKMVGHFFLKCTDRENVRICFVVLDPAFRGQGYGKAIMQAALAYAFDTLQARTAALAVFDNNPDAYHCYISVGFREETPTPPPSYTVMGEKWTCRSMEMSRIDWRNLTMDVYKEFAGQENVTVVPCWKNAEMLLLPDTDEDTYTWYWHELDGHRYERISSSNRGNGNHTAVFRKDGITYTLSYTAFERTCRLIRDPDTDLPSRIIAYPKVPVLVTQMRLLYACADCGMAYLIRMGDGRFAVIDSGMGEHEEPEHLLELMQAQNVRDGKPVIAVWFFTHPHIDHYNTFVNLMERHRDEIVLESVAYNWPTREMAKGFSDLTRFDALMETLTETKKITPRDGWTFMFPGVHFHILYTCEDLYPAPFANINDTSMVMQMTVENSVDYTVRRVLWMGDASAAASEYLVKKYDREVLECEIMQVGHHGYWGGSDALHRIVDAEVLLWPCPDFWYQVITKWDCNRYLVESEKVHTIYVAGQQEVVLNLDESIEPVDPYPETGSPVLYQEDFSDTSVYHKAWSSVTGGRTGYRGMGIDIEPGVCHLSAGEAWSVLEWVQPGRMTDSYVLTFRAKRTGGEGQTAIFWNHPTPTEWSDDAVLPLDLPSDPCTVELTADALAGKAILTIDGQPVREMAYMPADKHGLYLLLQNAEIDVYEITVKAIG